MMTQDDYIECFGCSQADLETYYKAKVSETRVTVGQDPGDAEMFVMSILSDAQFRLTQGDNEHARQLMNRAKYTLSTLIMIDRWP